jgi:hypothetical protein
VSWDAILVAAKMQLKVNKFAVLVDSHKKVYRKVNIDRLESGPIRGYIFGNWRENSNCINVDRG